jgi:hypothetical protein
MHIQVNLDMPEHIIDVNVVNILGRFMNASRWGAKQEVVKAWLHTMPQEGAPMAHRHLESIRLRKIEGKG